MREKQKARAIAAAFFAMVVSLAAMAFGEEGSDAGATDAGETADAAVEAGALEEASGAAASVPSKPRTLRVGVAGSEPFVIATSKEPEGISVEVWRAVAARAGAPYELVPKASVAEAIEGVRAGDLDVAIGPISITAERAKVVRFTQPYFQSSVAIAAPAVRRSLWARVSPFLSTAFFAGVGGLLLTLSLVGTLLWLSERHANPEQFPKDPVRGVGNGVWLALVTMTTVGYGDRTPLTVRGRIIAGVWMVISLLTATSLTAGIASALTLSQLDAPSITTSEDLAGKRVAVVSGTTGERFARRHNARLVQVASLPLALDAVASDHADAVVFDRPALKYQLQREVERPLLVSPSYEPQGYGFVLSLGSERYGQLNVALLELGQSGQIDVIVSQWLGSDP